MRTCPQCGEQNPDRFRVCGMCGSTLPDPPAAGEIRKTVTVLFADVSGSTALGERLDPESLRDVMSRFFGAMGEVIERHGGTVAKLLGDAVMAVFGIPSVHEDDALRAVRAAVDMREALDGINRQLSERFGVALDFRTGVNTGEVLAGDRVASQDLVIGDAVNVAARLEQAAGPGEILIGRDTWRLVRDGVRTEALDPLALRGKAGLVAAYRVLEVLPGAEAVTRHLDTPMVGRDRPLALLRHALESAIVERSSQLVTVLGPPGVGKSRLVGELVREAAGRAAALRGRCLSYGQGITYWPVAEMITQAAGIEPEDSPETARAKILARLEGEPDAAAMSDRVAEAVGAGQPSGDLAMAVRAFFEALARRSPLVAVFDDIHWAEPMLLDLIDHIADWSHDVPLLVVCMARLELLDLRPTWGGGKSNATSVSLEPLTEDESERLVDQLLGEVLDPSVRDRVAAASEGNPLFAEELVAMLLEEGRLRREDGRWRPTGDLSDLEVPPTIQALLAARVDRLPEDERVVLERASVAGKVFTADMVRSLLPEGLAADVASHLRGLHRRELIRHDRQAPGDGETYRFRHLLIRDAAYERLPKAHRADLHERFAGVLAETAGERMAEVEEIVGYHLEQAIRFREELGIAPDRRPELRRRAAGHLGSAGKRAYARADGPAAVKLLSRAVELLAADDPDRVELLPHLGAAHGDVGELDQAEAVYAEAQAAGRAMGNEGVEWLARVARLDLDLSVHPGSVDAEQGRGEVAQAIEVFERLDHHLGLALGWFLAGRFSDRWDDVRTSAARATEHARMAGRPRQEADGYGVQGLALLQGPARVEEGIAFCERARTEAGTNLLIEAWITSELSGLVLMVGRFDEARDLAQRGRALLEQMGLAFGIANALWWQGRLEGMLGDLGSGEQLMREAIDISRRSGDAVQLGWVLAELARLLCDAERYEEAVGPAGEAATLVPDSSRPGGLWLSDTVVGWRIAASRAGARLEDAAGAVDLAAEAVAQADRYDGINLQADAHLGLADVLGAIGRSGDAMSALREARARYERKGNTFGMARADHLAARLSETADPPRDSG